MFVFKTIQLIFLLCTVLWWQIKRRTGPSPIRRNGNNLQIRKQYLSNSTHTLRSRCNVGTVSYGRKGLKYLPLATLQNTTVNVLQQALETAQANMDRMSENGTLMIDETTQRQTLSYGQSKRASLILNYEPRVVI